MQSPKITVLMGLLLSVTAGCTTDNWGDDGDLSYDIPSLYAFDSDDDGFEDADDCSPHDRNTYPGAPEACDGIDNDCDEDIDEGHTRTVHTADADADGWGALESEVQVMACAAPEGMALPGDCDDTSRHITPGRLDICDALDNDCDGMVDENPDRIQYEDGDLDGFSQGDGRISCETEAGESLKVGDCNDGAAHIYPGAPEVWANALDEDCDGEDAVADIYVAKGEYAGLPDGAWVLETIQMAVDAVDYGQTIAIAPGVYSENITLKGKNLNLIAMEGAEQTQIISEGLTPAISHIASDLDGGKVEIKGLRISQDPNGPVGTDAEAVAGGGVYLMNTDATITDCIFDGHVVLGPGGAVAVFMGDLTFVGNRVENNASVMGGGVYGIDADLTLRNNHFVNNIAPIGGAIAVTGGSAQLFQNQIVDNQAIDHLDWYDSSATIDLLGGGIHALESDLILKNNLITGNQSERGGAIWWSSLENNSQFLAVNNTMADNRGDEDGGALYLRGNGLTVLNNIFANNESDYGFQNEMHVETELEIGHNLYWVEGEEASIQSRFTSDTDRYGSPDFQGETYLPGYQSMAIDGGDDGLLYLDLDGTRNDMGHLGGPEALEF